MRRDIPEPWAGWLIEAGMVRPRTKRPAPSARQLAADVDVHPSTILSMMHGEADTDPATIEAVAAALKRDVREVSSLVGQQRSVVAPWAPPAEVNLLTRRQQLAITELIRAIAEEGRDDGQQSAPIGPITARGLPAPEELEPGPTPQL